MTKFQMTIYQSLKISLNVIKDQTFDGVTEGMFWFQASPPSNRLFLEETGSEAAVRSVNDGVPDLFSFEEI